MKILIAEPEFPTHYHFIEHLLPVMVERFEQVIVALLKPQGEDHHYKHAFQRLECQPGVKILRIFDVPQRAPHEDGFKEEEARIRQCNFDRLTRSVQALRVEHVLMLSADKLVPLIAQDLAEHADSPWKAPKLHVGLHWLHLPDDGSFDSVFRDAGAEIDARASACSRQKQVLRAVQLIQPATVFVQNILALRQLRRLPGSESIHWVQGPVPIEVFTPVSKASARAQLDLPAQGELIGFTGSIQGRKGVAKFLEAMADHWLPGAITGLLMGPFEREIEALIARKYSGLVSSGRLITRNTQMSAFEQHLAVSALDLVLCNLQTHEWSSDIALRAIVAERPTLSGDGAWFRYMTSEFGMGRTVPVAWTGEKLAVEIMQSLQAVRGLQRSSSLKTIARFNSIENFAGSVVKAMLGEDDQVGVDRVSWPGCEPGH